MFINRIVFRTVEILWNLLECDGAKQEVKKLLPVPTSFALLFFTNFFHRNIFLKRFMIFVSVCQSAQL